MEQSHAIRNVVNKILNVILLDQSLIIWSKYQVIITHFILSDAVF